jgi:hypothetical protein
MPVASEQSDGLGPAIVDQEVNVTILINVIQSNGMGMRGYVDLKPRRGANLEAAPSDSE